MDLNPQDVKTNKRETIPKIKGKAVPVHAMRAYKGNRGAAPLILNLSTKHT
jgi:hypothetical protein